MSRNPCIACSRAVGKTRRCRRCGALQRVRDLVVEAVLATAARGRVYRARAPDGAVLVLKEVAFATVPDVQTLELFGRECEVLRRLSHPRIPRFIDGFRDGEGASLRLLLSQTYLPGENLEQRLSHHTFDEAEARAIAADLLDVLTYLHGRSPAVVHRDLKPSNVIALEDGRFGLVDFGSVRAGPSARAGAASTITGTFGFMPPEQLSREADARSDLYALGMTLCRILSRRHPEELLTPALEVSFLSHVNLSAAFAAFIGRLVARAPEDRFASAAEALTALVTCGRSSHAPTVDLPRVDAAMALRDLSAPRPPAPAPVPSKGDPRFEPGPQVPWRLSLGGKEFILRPNRQFVVGRAEDCDVRVEDTVPGADTVSRHHLRIFTSASSVTVEELGSRNGTMVGGRYIRPAGDRVVVTDGIELELGKLRAVLRPAFLVLDAEPNPSRRTLPAPQRWPSEIVRFAVVKRAADGSVISVR